MYLTAIYFLELITVQYILMCGFEKNWISTIIINLNPMAM